MELTFWVTVLFGWCYTVHRSLSWFDRVLDRFLDGWFAPETVEICDPDQSLDIDL
jgi:hypothetical protein